MTYGSELREPKKGEIEQLEAMYYKALRTLDLARNGNSEFANEILGWAKCHF